MAESSWSTAPVIGRTPRVSTPVRALRFAVVGTAGVVVNVLVLQVLYAAADLPLLVASPVAVGTAVVHNYLVNNRWTFGWRRVSLARFAWYGLSSLTTILLNVAVVWSLVGVGVHHLPADLAGIAVAAGLNFGASTLWVWRDTGTSARGGAPAGPAGVDDGPGGAGAAPVERGDRRPLAVGGPLRDDAVTDTAQPLPAACAAVPRLTPTP
ncbi:GtrA family protein [Geodermatophilus sp. SYSU D01062]